MNSTAKQRYKLTIGYDGTNYAGWQVQPRKKTVQGEIEKAIKEISGECVRLNSSGRTDSGVHAREQVAHVDLEKKFAAARLMHGINRYIDRDIRILKAEQVPAEFDARFSATGKEYRYFIHNARIVPPHLRLYRAHVNIPLDVDAMKRAASVLEGKHDFIAFSPNPGYTREDTIRTLYVLKILKKGPEICLVVRGNGFMFKMVRGLAGCLLRVGKGDLSVEQVKSTLRGQARTVNIPTAQAHGLFLWRVFYGKVPTT